MISFREFREGSEEAAEKSALEVVRKGMGLGDDFWDGFLSLCGNVEGMSDLLGAPREKITGLGNRIRGLINTVREQDSSSRKRDKMIKTGDKT